MTLNIMTKIVVHTPRPYEVMDSIQGKRLDSATGYAFPSGHVQGAATFFSSIALIVRKYWAYALALAAIVLVALSRMYLGVHWPIDVLGGSVLGIISSIILFYVFDKVFDNPKKLNRLIIWLLTAVGVSATALWVVNLFWLEQNYMIPDFMKLLGVVYGAGIGFILEQKHVRFVTKLANRWIYTSRFIAGLVITFLIMNGLKYLFPASGIFDFIRYFCTGIWITFAFPWIGKRLKWFEAEE